MNNEQTVDGMLAGYLQKARNLANQERFDEALNTLREAWRIAAGDERGLINACASDIQKQQQQQVQALTRDVENLLARKPETLTPEDLAEGERILARLQNVHRKPAEMETLSQRWRAQRQQAETWQEYEETRQELDALWQAPVVVLSGYDRALALARQKAGQYEADQRFQELLAEAERRREGAYKEEGELTTQATEGNFEPLFALLERMRREGYSDLPWYDWGTREIEGVLQRSLTPGGQAPADEAITHLRELAAQYQNAKAKDYLGRAQTELPAHPKAAADWIEEVLAFKYIGSVQEKELQAFLQQTIQPALERRQQAAALVQDALQTLDIQEAWLLLDQAVAVDRYATEIEGGRKQLRPRLQIHLEGLLTRAAEKRQAGDFEAAEGLAGRITKLARDDAELQRLAQQAQELARACDTDRQLYKTAQTDAERIQALLDADLAAASQALAELEARLAGRPETFQGLLRDVRHKVQARQSLEALLAGWEGCFQAADPIRLSDERAYHQAVGELDRLGHEIGQAIAERGQQPRLADFQARVQARRNLAQGWLNWQAGLYDKARLAWERTASARREDAPLAEDWLVRVRDATAVSEAIEAARAHRQNGAFKEALDALKNWRIKASPKQSEAQSLYRQIEQEWADQLEKEIDRLVAHLEQRPAYHELIEKVDQLELLRPDNAQKYKYDHLAPIYEKWGDQAMAAGSYPEAEARYQEASRLTGDTASIRLKGKRHRARRHRVYFQVEERLTAGKREEARQKLIDWTGEAPGDVASLVWLAELALEDEQSERAEGYIQRAERCLESAEREQNPALAGLDGPAEIDEWRRRLAAWRVRTRIVARIGQARRSIGERLEPRAGLGEYHMAQEARDGLIEEIEQEKKKVLEQEMEQPRRATLPQEVQERIRRTWEGVQRWLETQTADGGDIALWYNDLERKLLRQLRSVWTQSQVPDVDRLDFRAAKPAKDLQERWETGLKMRFLLRESSEGELAFLEITNALGRLGAQAGQVIQDYQGPEYGLKGERLTPGEALGRQLDWSYNLLAWAKWLKDLLEGYVWATEKSSSTQEDTASSKSRCSEIYEQVEHFKNALQELERAVRQANKRLEQAIAAGKEGRQRWEHVNWRKLILDILQAPQSRLSREGQPAARVNWNDLEHADAEKRWQAWAQAAEILLAANLASQPERAPWEIINAQIVQAGIEEKWEEIIPPESEHTKIFREHRAFRECLQEKYKAQERRKRLVLLTIELQALSRAEEFQAALSRMEQIETEDAGNRYGFRQEQRSQDSQASEWEKLEASLREGLRQWEIYQDWWAEVERSALGRWKQEARRQAIQLAHEADFDNAMQLARDALNGAQKGGRTNQLGGGKALTSLIEHLEKRPDDLQPPHSFRLRRALQEADRWQHDAHEAADELRFWLGEGNEPHHSGDIAEPLSALQAKFSVGLEALKINFQALEEAKTWPGKKNAKKEEQRESCLKLLAGLESLAPDWPELGIWRQRIREA